MQNFSAIMENRNCDKENLAFDGTQPAVYNRRFCCARSMSLPQKIDSNLQSINSILAVALYSGKLAANILQRVLDEPVPTGYCGKGSIEVVLNELRNVCSCIEDTVFALEETMNIGFVASKTAGSTRAVTFDDAMPAVEDTSHNIYADGLGIIIFDEMSYTIDNTFSKWESASLEPEKSVGIDALINECIRVCEHLLAYFRTLKKSPSISDVSISDPICGISVCDRSSSIPIHDGSTCDRSILDSARSSSVCDRSILDLARSSSVAMETLKYGMKALESALASLHGIVSECDMNKLF